MKIITCFIPPTKGTVSVEGFDIWEQSMEVRKRVGYLPEHNPLYLDMYVKEYLEFIAGIHHITGQEASKRINEMIEITGLGVEMHKKIGALSKGYRQRVGLAQAMIHNPSVLILDEPTSGLDPNQLIDIRRLIKDLGNEKTVLLSTHIMQEVEALCDKVIIINKGVVVANDNIENLTKESDNVLVVEFDGKVTSEMLSAIVGLKQAKAIKENHWILEPKADLDIRQDLMRWAINNNVIIKSMQREETSIEECFQRLTRV
jgi:ABC-2 type transport system ATP-binding protein